DNKVYNGTDAATISGCTLDAASGDTGVIAGDVNNVGCTGSNGHFADADAGNGKTVPAHVALTGTAAGNYQLSSSSASTTANIAKRSVTASITADNKVCNGPDAATISGCTLDAASGDTGIIAGDVNNVGCTGSNGHFADAHAGNGKTVTAHVALTAHAH